MYAVKQWGFICLISSALGNTTMFPTRVVAESTSPYVGNYKNLILFGDEDKLLMNLEGVNAFWKTSYYKKEYICDSYREQIGVRTDTYTDYQPTYELSRNYHSRHASQYGRNEYHRDQHSWKRRSYDDHRNRNRDEYRYDVSNDYPGMHVRRVVLTPVQRERQTPIYETKYVTCSKAIPYITYSSRWDYSGILDITIDKSGQKHENFIFSSGVKEQKGVDTFYTEAFDAYPTIVLYKINKLDIDFTPRIAGKLKNYAFYSSLKLLNLSSWLKNSFSKITWDSKSVTFEVDAETKLDKFSIHLKGSFEKQKIQSYTSLLLGNKRIVTFNHAISDLRGFVIEVEPEWESYQVLNPQEWKNKLKKTYEFI